jgi:hypothetical protein
MSKIITLEQFRDYLKYRCGYPLSVVEIDDAQLDIIIEDATQFFIRENNSEGSYIDYAVFNCLSGVDTYSLSGVQGVFDMNLSIGIDGINTLFSPSHELLYSDFVRKGSILGSDTPDFSPGLTMTSYDSAMLFLEEVKQQFGRCYTVYFNPNREELKIFPMPNDNMVGVLYLYRKEEAVKLYNHQLVKKLAFAKTLIQWGINLTGKYGTVTLPDGLTLDGNTMRTKGETDEAAAEQMIRDQSPPGEFFMM